MYDAPPVLNEWRATPSVASPESGVTVATEAISISSTDRSALLLIQHP
jgi:hypothetical protein